MRLKRARAIDDVDRRAGAAIDDGRQRQFRGRSVRGADSATVAVMPSTTVLSGFWMVKRAA